MQSTSPIWKWLWNEDGKNLPPSEYEGDIVSFDNPGYTYPKDITIGIEPVQSGSGDPSPTNVRPISGWTGANVWDDPKYGGTVAWNQLVDYLSADDWRAEGGVTASYADGIATMSNSIANTNGIQTKILKSVQKDHKYLLSIEAKSPTVMGDAGRFGQYSGSGVIMGFAVPTVNTWIARAVILNCTNSNNTHPFYIYCSTAYDNLQVRNPQIIDLTQMFGTAIADQVYAMEQTTPGAGVAWFRNLFPKDYYAYNAGEETCVSAVNGDPYTHIPISWQSEAGTVYGGTLDVTTGLLTVEMGMVDLGTLNWYYQPNWGRANSFYAVLDIKQVPSSTVANMLCSIYKTVNADGIYLGTDKAICNNGIFTRVSDSSYTDAVTFKTAMSGVQLVYELATPQTYQLSPTDVALLLGVNNVWADTGDMTVALVSAGYTRLEARAVIAGTVYTDISAPVIHRAAMQGALSVGNVAAASLALTVRGAGSIPRSAAVVIETRLNDGQTASEWLPQGTFYISRRGKDPVTGLLALECYDALLKANALWTPSAGVWPRTMAAVAAELASLLGLEIDSRTEVPEGAEYVVAEPVAGTTVRDALGGIAQAAGGSWIVTPGNRLRLVTLDGAGDALEVAGVVGGMDAGPAGTVTGVRSTVDGVATLTGDDTGIVVDVTVAPMIAADMAERLIGLTYQPFRLTGAVYDPAAELGDAVRAGAAGEVASALWDERVCLGPAVRGEIAAPEAGEVTDEYPYISKNESAISLLKARVQELSDTAVAGTTILYASGASATDPPAEGWSTTPPEHVDGRYVWQKVVTLYADGRSETSAAVNISGADGADATVLRIDSSRGTVFKNNQVSTVLSVAIYHGPDRVTDTAGLARVFGPGAYLQWSWQRMGEDRYGVISSDDSRIGDGGFTFTLSPADVDTKVTFMCELIVN